MKNVKVIKKAAIFLMVFVLAFSSLSAAAAVTYSRGGKSLNHIQRNPDNTVLKCLSSTSDKKPQFLSYLH